MVIRLRGLRWSSLPKGYGGMCTDRQMEQAYLRWVLGLVELVVWV